MKKLVLVMLVLVLVVIPFAGCKQTEELVDDMGDTISGWVDDAEEKKEDVLESETTATTSTSTEIMGKTVEEQLKGLTKTEGVLEVEVNYDKNQAVEAGVFDSVEVTVTNTSAQTAMVFNMGNEDFETPASLMMKIDGLQTVMPEDHLTVEKVDFKPEVLRPGQSETYTLYFMTSKPDSDFDGKTFAVLETDDAYIADLSWDTLDETNPELMKASVGEYTGQVYFTFTGAETEAEIKDVSKMEMYSVADFTVNVK